MAIVSVIIPTFNREKYVTKAIESVLAQTYRASEVIVVDDGSTDQTERVLREYKEKITYIHQKNSGVSAARNAGIQSARGEWLAFLDSDDEWMASYLSTQLERAQQTPDICMQTANCRITELDGRIEDYFEMNGCLSEFNGKDYLLIENPFPFIVKHIPWPIQSTMILRSTLRKAGLFDRRFSLSEDFDFMARVAMEGQFGMIREQLVNIYRRNETIECLTGQSYKNPIKAREANEKVFEKLRRIRKLGHNDCKVLNQMTSANRRAIGNLLIKASRIKEARDSYRRALLLHPSISSFGKYILSFLPGKNVRS